MTENEKLRALLAEVVQLNTPCPSCLRTIEEERCGYGREGCSATAQRLLVDAALAKPVDFLMPTTDAKEVRWEMVQMLKRERDEARAEVDRLKHDLDDAWRRNRRLGEDVGVLCEKAYQRGAETMREVAARYFDTTPCVTTTVQAAIRALPVPEDKP